MMELIGLHLGAWVQEENYNSKNWNWNSRIQQQLVMAGGSTTNSTAVEQYDGSSWTNGNAMPYSRSKWSLWFQELKQLFSLLLVKHQQHANCYEGI